MLAIKLGGPGPRGPGRGSRYLGTAVAAVGTLGLAVGGVVAVAGTAQAASSMYVAPYVDMSNSQESVLNTVISSHGLQAYTAAFAIGEGCTDIWGDTLPIGSDPTIGGEISSAKAAGAQVIVSSGGAAGLPLSFTCGTQSTIDAGYQAIINDYGTDYLDFDIEGTAIANTTGIDQTFQAMKDLKASNPSLVWSVTVPVLPTGLDNYGTALLQDAANMGVTIPIVNIMTMDYYQGNIEMGQAAISAAQATLNQMRAVNSSYTYAHVGITPMIGVNDDGSTFTLSDASTVASWAASNGIGRLAFWSVDRDQNCPGGATGGAASSTCSGVSQSTGAFTGAFLSSGGGGGGGGGGGTDAPFGGTAAAVPGTVYAANYDTGGQGVAYNVTSTNGSANSYRSDGVDLETTSDTVNASGGGVYDQGWTTSGQWFHYTVNVASAGTYTVSLRVAAPSAVTNGLDIANSAGTDLSGLISIPATGGWQNWTTVTASVTLSAGQQTLTVYQDAAGWNLHLLSFASAAGTGGGSGSTGVVTGYQGLCLDVRSASNADGTPVQVYTCNGTTAQQWTVGSNGTVQALSKCLDVVGAGTANGTKVDLYTCNGTGAQQWQAQSNGELINTNSGSCLDDTGSGGSGTQVQIWACADTANQQWHLP